MAGGDADRRHTPKRSAPLPPRPSNTDVEVMVFLPLLRLERSDPRFERRDRVFEVG